MSDHTVRTRIEQEQAAWEANELAASLKKLPETKEEFVTVSDIPVKRLYTPLDVPAEDYLEKVGFPGRFPFTRGIHPTMYRARPWTRRQVVGLGTASATNERHKYVLSQGQTGLSNDFDHPTLVGLDSDDPASRGEVGRIGVAIDTVQDMHMLMDGIPLDRVSTSMTINHPTPVLLAMYVAVAQDRNVPLDQLRGTVQNDPLKEFYAQKTFVFPPQPALKMMTDVLEFSAKYLPRWNPISVCTYQTRDAGGSVEHELAFSIASAMEYIRLGMERGMDVDEFVPRFSWLFYVHNDFFEEIAKFRAARRIWATVMRDKFGAKRPESMLMRVHCQTGGSTLQMQQPEVNIIRGTVQALAAVLGGVQSMAISCYDEALSIPTEKSQRLALRTQQVILHESRAGQTVDPLGGSYFVENLTNTLEEKVWALLDEIEERGGMTACVESGWVSQLIADEAYRTHQKIQNKEDIIVGVNEYRLDDDLDEPQETFRVDLAVAEEQIRNLQAVRRQRDSRHAMNCLKELEQAAKQDKNLMPFILDAVKAYCSEGEIIGTLKSIYGEFRSPNLF